MVDKREINVWKLKFALNCIVEMITACLKNDDEVTVNTNNAGMVELLVNGEAVLAWREDWRHDTLGE